MRVVERKLVGSADVACRTIPSSVQRESRRSERRSGSEDEIRRVSLSPGWLAVYFVSKSKCRAACVKFPRLEA